MLENINKKLDKKLLVFAILTVIGLIAYCNSFTVPFILDDFGSIANNFSIRPPINLFEIWKFYSNRFVIYLTFALNYAIHDTAVEGYHIVNLIIHIFSGILVYLIIYELIGLPHFRKKPVVKYRNIASILAAMVFLSHPLQVNAVTYVVQRTAALAATFFFLAIYLFIRFRITGRVRYFVIMMVSILFAMFTKENTITIPFMLLFLELLFFMKDGKTKWWQRLIFFFIIFLTIPIIPATTTFLKGYSQSDPNVAFKASTSMDRFHYFYTQMNVIILYIKLLFIPDKQNFDYSNDFPISKTIWQNNSYISLIILALIGIYGLVNFRRNKLVCLGVLWFFIGLSVESSFISIKDVYFEHRLYFPIAGFAIFLIGAFFSERRRIIPSSRYTNFALGFVVVMCFMTVFYTGLTIKRNYVYADPVRLWSDTAEKAPKSDRAHSVLASAHLDKYEEDKKINKDSLDKAEKEFKIAIALNDRNSTAHCNLSKVYLLKKDYDNCIKEARKTNSITRSEYAYYNMAMAHKGLNKIDEAINNLLEGYKIEKRRTFILKELGNLYNQRKDYKNAKRYYEEFLKVNIYSDNKTIKKKLEEINKELSDTAKTTAKTTTTTTSTTITTTVTTTF